MSGDDIYDDACEQLLTDLTDRDMQVLKSRFGVDLSSGSKREIVAAMLEISREKIEAIERKALKKLRNRDEE